VAGRQADGKSREVFACVREYVCVRVAVLQFCPVYNIEARSIANIVTVCFVHVCKPSVTNAQQCDDQIACCFQGSTVTVAVPGT